MQELREACSVKRFFVPASLPTFEERIYASFAQWCNRAVPAREQRIYSITFGPDGETWMATVGLPLRGVLRAVNGTRQDGLRERWVGDPARVLAIFPGEPYVVVTNHLMHGISVGSMFANPLLVRGEPRAVQYFAAAFHQT